MTFRRSLVLLAATVLAACFALPARALERDQVPDAYKWNLADLYPGDTAWAQARSDIAAAIPKLAKLQGTLPLHFQETLSAIFDVELQLDRLRAYAMFRKDEDQRAGEPRDMDQTATRLGVDFDAATSWLRPEILALGAEKVHDFVAADARLAPYRPWLEDLLRYEPHTLSAAEEKVASQAGIMADGGTRAYDTFTNADLPYPQVTLSTGETVTLDAQGYTRYRALPDRADRDSVFHAFWSRYRQFERTIGATYSAVVQAHLFQKQVHKYDSCLEAALFDSDVPPSVYRQLIADVHANLPTLHRYLRLRQRLMGLDRIGYEDLYAPILKEVDLRYTPEQAQQLVLAAVAPLGPEYVAALAQGYKSRWIDLMPTTGKTSGAYSEAVYGVHPYQLENFTGLYEEVSTLAHESGHSMHSFLTNRAQPYPTSGYKTFVAEVASTLNENLLLHLMLSRTKDRDTRLFLLGSYLDGLRTTLFRQTLFAEFELKAHEMAERGESLTGENLSRLYLGLLKYYYGDALGVCAIDDRYGIEWAYIHHFHDYDFYVFQYATSITASAQIAANMRADAAARKPSTKARDAYLRLLAAGSSKPPIELLKDAGVDMTSSGPFNAAIAEMNGVMDEMEKLIPAK
jgi:oligoendopeptidase F